MDCSCVWLISVYKVFAASQDLDFVLRVDDVL